MIRKISMIFTPGQRLKAMGVFVIIFVGTIVELVGVGAILPFVNAVLSPDEILSNPVVKQFYDYVGFTKINDFLVFLGVGIIIIYIFKNIFVFFLHSAQYRFSYDSQRELSHRMFCCYIREPYAFHLDHNSAELIRNINEDVALCFEAVLSLLQLLSEGLVCGSLLVLLLWQDFKITMGVVALAGSYVLFFMKVAKKRLNAAGREARETVSRARQTVLEGLGSIKELKVLGRESSFEDDYERSFRGYADSQRRLKVYSMVSKPVLETICVVGLLAIISVRIALGEDPRSFIPTLSLFALAAFRMLPSANRIAEYLSRIMFSKPAVDAIYEDLEEIGLLEGGGAVSGRTDTVFGEKESFLREICISNMEFSYPGADRRIFDGADIVIPRNKSVALIGPSGQGKTTLADILLGLLSMQAGTLTVDGRSVDTGSRPYRELFGYVPQSVALLDASIRDNILFGARPDGAGDEKLNMAMEKAQMMGFVRELPDGVDTEIGENGIRLSGGQRQRIGIARALFEDPEILILDEATSALDNETEAAVMEAIDFLAGQKTLIIIAHRLSTIKNCDLVYRVEDGRIVRER